MKLFVVALCLCGVMVTAGCASHQDAAGVPLTAAQNADRKVAASLDNDDQYMNAAFSTQLIPDPLEPWNRAMFVLNDGIITYVARPLNTGYTTVTPKLLQDSIFNFFRNLMFPVRFANNLLQGKGHEAGLEFSQFIINTSAGLGGLFNVAKRHPEFASLDSEDFGQTLGVWGVGEGMYLYWPILGPSTARDTVGKVGDYFLDPITYIKPWQASWSLVGMRTLSELDGILDAYDDITKSAVEPYTAVRDAFVQFRRARVAK